MAKNSLPRWTLALIKILLVVTAAIGGAVALTPALIKHVVEREGTAKLHRRVLIHGPVVVDWLQGPKIILNRLTVSNPDWAKGRMVVIKQVRLRLKPWPLMKGQLVIASLVLRSPHIRLDKPVKARPNWVFSPHKELGAKSLFLPIERLIISHGLIRVRDVPAHTHLAITVGSTRHATRLVLTGHGRYKGAPFTLMGMLGSPHGITQSQAPYPVLVTVRIGRFLARAQGALAAPFALKNACFRVLLKGGGLGRVDKAVDLPLPETGPFQIAGQLRKTGNTWILSKIQGLVGKSDLAGTISVRPGSPLFLRAHLVSQTLDFKDLAGFLKAKPQKVAGHVKVLSRAQNSQEAFPTTPYKRSRLLKLDADVIYQAKHVYASHMRIQELSTHLVISHGIVTFHPLDFRVADGVVAADLTMNVRHRTYQTDLRALARGLKLRLLLPQIPFKTAGSGQIGGHLRVTAPGNSIAAMARHASGHLGLALAHGSIANLYVALAQLHVGNAALDWFSGQKRESIPCAVVRLRMKNGLVKTRTFVIDTPSANIFGRGTVNMRTQALHFVVLTKPRHVTIISVRGPLRVSGTLKKPVFRVDRTAVAWRVGAAVALGALLTPAAALLPLIDTAPGHKIDCPALLNKAAPQARAEALKRIHKRSR